MAEREARPFTIRTYHLAVLATVFLTYFINPPAMSQVRWPCSSCRTGPPAYPVPGVQTFTVKQVEEHATEQSAWIIVEGQVYDMTGELAEPEQPPAQLADAPPRRQTSSASTRAERRSFSSEFHR